MTRTNESNDKASSFLKALNPLAAFSAARGKGRMKLRELMYAGAIFLGIACSCAPRAQESEWVSLFDGQTLNGWEVRSGYATYKVEDGAIVGTTAVGTGNTFLCTMKQYGDFVLEFEVKCDTALNSGVQFRSHFYPKDTMVLDENGRSRSFPADRMHGYQFEIDPKGTGNGRIYDEARRRTMIGAPYKNNVELRENQWNKCRLIAQGDRIRTFVNGVAVSDFHDDMTDKGYFGLQVHALRAGLQGPYSVSWRNIMIRELKPGEAVD